jgi:hypothetical protein
MRIRIFLNPGARPLRVAVRIGEMVGKNEIWFTVRSVQIDHHPVYHPVLVLEISERNEKDLEKLIKESERLSKEGPKELGFRVQVVE